jgi:pantothenate kinase
VPEFMNYPASDNAALLRQHYQHLLTGPELVICTNRATMNTLKHNKELEQAITEVIMKKFRLEHTERIENSVHAMMILESTQQEFYRFVQNFSILELNTFETVFTGERRFIQPIPDQVLVVSLRNGVTAYRVAQGKIERIEGSIIGENTFTSILRMKFPEARVQDCFELAFSGGSLKNVDLMVEDIYGKGSAKIGLPGEMVASSLGKFGKMKES